MRQNQGRLLVVLDDIGHGESLAGAGHAEQRLLTLARVEAVAKLLDRLRLVARGAIFTLEFKLWHML